MLQIVTEDEPGAEAEAPITATIAGRVASRTDCGSTQAARKRTEGGGSGTAPP